MNITRRKLATTTGMFLSLAALSACATGTAVPSLAQVQAWVGVLNTELPLFVQESISTGLITGNAVSQVQTGLVTFQHLAQQVLSSSFTVSGATQIITEVGAALTTIASPIPAAAPYAGLIQLTILVITSFIAASPIVVPPVPTAQKLATLHASTLKFHPTK